MKAVPLIYVDVYTLYFPEEDCPFKITWDVEEMFVDWAEPGTLLEVHVAQTLQHQQVRSEFRVRHPAPTHSNWLSIVLVEIK